MWLFRKDFTIHLGSQKNEATINNILIEVQGQNPRKNSSGNFSEKNALVDHLEKIHGKKGDGYNIVTNYLIMFEIKLDRFPGY